MMVQRFVILVFPGTDETRYHEQMLFVCGVLTLCTP